MNEEKIKELLSELFRKTAIKKYSSSSDSYTVNIIDKDHQTLVEQIIRGFLADNRDSRIGELEAKVFVYEQIISKSNFSTILIDKNVAE